MAKSSVGNRGCSWACQGDGALEQSESDVAEGRPPMRKRSPDGRGAQQTAILRRETRSCNTAFPPIVPLAQICIAARSLLV